MDIQQEMVFFKSKIDEEIRKSLDKSIENARKHDVFLAEALEYVKTFILSGGKRLRGALMYHGYLLVGGHDREEILRTCVSVELTHAFLLVHDDIMDRDETRHGVETVHTRYTHLARTWFSTKSPEHFGVSMAICIGDMVAALGSQCVFTSKFPADRIVAALNRLQEIVGVTVAGQIKDVYMEYAQSATEKDVLSMYENKTARYTIEGPLHLGAILAGAPQSLMDAFSQYAVPLGVAFQIQDDILGMFGEKQKTGKPVGSDIEEGKMTLLVVQALRRANSQQKTFLKNVLGKSPLTDKEVQKVCDIIEKTGSRSYAQELANRYVAQSLSALKTLDTPAKESLAFIRSIADYIATRHA